MSRRLLLLGDAINEHGELNVHEECITLKKKINDLSKFAHISPKTHNLPDPEASSFLHAVEDALIGFCEAFVRVRNDASEKILMIIQKELDERFLEDVPENLLQLSCWTRFEEASVHKIGEIDLYSQEIDISGEATVSITLDYRSLDTDRDGDCEFPDSYPCSFTVTYNMEKFSFIEFTALHIDTSSFYGDEEFDPGDFPE